MKACRHVLMALTALLAPHPAIATETVYRSAGANGLPHFTNAPSAPGAQVWMTFEKPLVRVQLDESTTPLSRAARASRCCDAQTAEALRVASSTYHIDESLLRAVIRVESGFDPKARSHSGAAGLMQLMPATAQRFGVKDRFDVHQNVNAGARYLRELLDAFKGDLRLALAAYNAGEGAVRRSGNRIPSFPETMAYVPAVLAHYRDEHQRRRLAEEAP